jgi:acetoin utilization deacetylase AcuC-like enzyme
LHRGNELGAQPVTTALFSHDDCLSHDMGHGHPERPDRLRAVQAALATEAFARLDRREAPLGADAHILLAHPERHLAHVLAQSPAEGLAAIDADTAMGPHTLAAARRAVGGAVAAVDAVMGKAARNAFVATRPPGHHAEQTRVMGFCFFNNAAIAARHAIAAHGAGRVAIMDWDVHHGNGTQDIVWDDPAILYVSTHEMPLYPGTGHPSERGAHDNVLNVALKAGEGGEAFQEAFEAAVLPRIKGFSPDLLIISAGFDAHWRDPLANLNLTEQDFAWATRALMEIADAGAAGRVVSLLEGGYDLKGLGGSVAAHVAELMTG